MRKIKNIMLMLVALVLATGCIKEDYDDCDNVTIYFQYLADGDTDVLYQYMRRVDLYVFDEGGHLMGTRQYSQDELSSFSAKPSFKLPAGKRYKVVAVGNAYDDTEVVNVNATSFDDIFLQHPNWGSAEKVTNHDHNYLGQSEFFVTGGDGVMTRDTVTLYSSHVNVDVEIHGLANAGTSECPYELSIEIAFTDGWRYTIPTIAFHTKSFAGTYEWVCPTGSLEDSRKLANFAVTVEEGTETQYTIYTNEKDCFYTERYRLLPLIDGSVTSPIDYNNPAEEYKEANTAYDWNYRKWSIDRIAGLAKLKTWLPEMTENYRDRTVTSVRTTTSVLPATTATTWEFRENEQHQAEVVFTNKGSGLAASGIYSGPDKSNMFVLSCIEEAGV